MTEVRLKLAFIDKITPRYDTLSSVHISLIRGNLCPRPSKNVWVVWSYYVPE